MVCRLAAFVLIGHLAASRASLAQTFEVVTPFVPASKGASPLAALIQASDGSFYGTTVNGGDSGYGTVFKMDASGTLTRLHSFSVSHGAYPYAGLIQASDGSFYGTTAYGGASAYGTLLGYGTVFKMDRAGTLTTLHSFTGFPAGSYPTAGLIQASDGSFYGTTSEGGAANVGTVFRVDAAGTLTMLHSFNGTEGASPQAGLIQASDGSFYGTTSRGGASDFGTVFKVDAAGTLTPVQRFTGNNGAYPFAGLIQASDGSFYGTTAGGGASDRGTVFKLDVSGTLTTLHSFTGGSEGASPNAGLLQASDGSFYGTTAGGGASDRGTVFKLDVSRTLTTLHSFTGGSDGAFPEAALIQASDGGLYGTTREGGGAGAGVVFRIRLQPSTLTTGVFRPSNGALYLKSANTAGFADAALTYGLPGDYPVTGDWDGDGIDTIGIYRDGTFYLRNLNSIGFADLVVAFGMPGDQPVVGDWNGDGITTIGVYRNGTFLLRNSNTAGPPDLVFTLGAPGDIGISGDWDGNGTVTTGVFRPSNGAFYLKNANQNGIADVVLTYGITGDLPVTGDWDGDGIDTIGVYRNGTFYLRNSNTNGFADMTFSLGMNGDYPLAGRWGQIGGNAAKHFGNNIGPSVILNRRSQQ